jgi:hypothetical protein
MASSLPRTLDPTAAPSRIQLLFAKLVYPSTPPVTDDSRSDDSSSESRRFTEVSRMPTREPSPISLVARETK